MNSKRLTVWIDEREALPVRAIPIVAGRSFSADVIAESFARERVSRTPVSYRKTTNGIEPLHPRQWEPTVRQIDALQARTNEKHKGVSDEDDAWSLKITDNRDGAFELLPAGVFVWLDDFEQEYHANGEKGLILVPMALLATEYAVVMEGFEKNPEIDKHEAVIAYAAKASMDETQKPWTIANINDPEPEQNWYIAARYFARKLVIDDSTLLTKKNILAGKISASLTSVGIFKRGGKLPIAKTTILKSLTNITLG